MSDEFDEATIAAYVDGELPAERAHALELHLVRSQESRRLVLALREEAALLRDALQERPQTARVAARSKTPARGLAIGGLPALGVGLAVLAVLGLLLEQRMPTGYGWLNPVNLIGAYEMAFNLIFWVRDRAPQLVELVLAVALTASLSALLSFGVSVIVRRIGPPASLGLALLLALAPAGAARAVDIQKDQENVSVERGTVLEQTLIAAADNVHVDGVIEGDLLAFAERVVVSGEVRGNVFALTRSLEITGKVHGSVHGASERVRLEGEVAGDIYSFSDRFTVTRDGKIGRDLNVLGSGVVVEGAVGRDLFSGAEWFELRGSVGRDADLRGVKVSLFDGAEVARDLQLHMREGEEADVASGARVGGEVSNEVLDHDFGHEESWGEGLLGALVFLVSAFLVGMALYAVLPGIYEGDLENAGDFFRSLGLGFLALVVTPVALVLVFLTVVGIPIAVIGSWIYLTALFVSVIVVSEVIGRAVMRREPSSYRSFGLVLLVGLLIVGVVTNLPFIGGIATFLTLLTGLGLLVGGLLDWRGEQREGAVESW